MGDATMLVFMQASTVCLKADLFSETQDEGIACFFHRVSRVCPRCSWRRRCESIVFC